MKLLTVSGKLPDFQRNVKYEIHNSDVNRLSRRCYKVSLKVNKGLATVLRL